MPVDLDAHPPHQAICTSSCPLARPALTATVPETVPVLRVFTSAWANCTERRFSHYLTFANCINTLMY